MSKLAPPYSSFTVEGGNLNINNMYSGSVDDWTVEIQGDNLVIDHNEVVICRGNLADFTGLTGATLVAKMQYFNNNYTYIDDD